MSQPMNDAIPPELTVDEPPLSDDVLDALDEAFVVAMAEGPPLDYAAFLTVGDDDDLAGDDTMRMARKMAPPAARHWEIVDDAAAQWAMAHVARIDADLGRDAEQRDEWQARIDHWFTQASDRALRRRAFFVAHLVAYGAARRERDPKAPKTLALPSGRITSRDVKPTVKVVDGTALAAWLAERDLLVTPEGDALVQTTTKVYAVPLRKVLQPAGTGLVIVPTGEVLTADQIPAGLDVEPAHTDYDVKPS